MENDKIDRTIVDKDEIETSLEDVGNEETPAEEVDGSVAYDEELPAGWTFQWGKLVIGVAVCYYFFNTNLSVFLYFALVVIIHELGHVVLGKLFGCFVTEMQVFLLSFVSYKPAERTGGGSWREITWSLGVLPLGGFTVFKTRNAQEYDEMEVMDKYEASSSPYIDDKPAWQRLLISAGGVLFNLVTFLALYLAMPHLPLAWLDVCWPIMSFSLILVVLNILPVYPLDGGSIIFACYEMISGRKPSKKFVQYCGMIGFILIILFFWVFPQWVHGILDSVFGMFF